MAPLAEADPLYADQLEAIHVEQRLRDMGEASGLYIFFAGLATGLAFGCVGWIAARIYFGG